MANLKAGDKALSFTLPGVDGQTYSLAGLSRGQKATAVIFMCNHCPYVLGWLGRLRAVAHDYGPRDVAFVGINANDAAKYPADSLEKMQELAADWSLPFPYLHDETQEVAAAYGAERTPEIFLFDGNLDLVYHGAPDNNRDEQLATDPYLRDALEAVLTGKKPPVQETPPVGCTIKWK